MEVACKPRPCTDDRWNPPRLRALPGRQPALPEDLSIVFTTNRPVTAAMLDRLLHRSVVVTLDGVSYRLRNHHAAAERLRRVTTGSNPR